VLFDSESPSSSSSSQDLMAASSSAVHKRHLEVHFGDFGTKLYTKLLGKPFPIPEKEAPRGLLRPPRAPKRRLRDSPRRSILPRSPTPARRSTPARIPVLKEVSNTQAETAVGTQTGTQADIQAGAQADTQAGAQEDDNTDDNDQDFDPYGPPRGVPCRPRWQIFHASNLQR
jgi:hypothetical protein